VCGEEQERYLSICICVGFEVLTAVTMKTKAFRVVTLVLRKEPGVSEENIASIFGVKDRTRYETSRRILQA
jgi:hypothetical protein